MPFRKTARLAVIVFVIPKLRPAPAGLFLPVVTPKRNAAVQLKAGTLDKRVDPAFDCYRMFLGGVKILAYGLWIAAVILVSFP